MNLYKKITLIYFLNSLCITWIAVCAVRTTPDQKKCVENIRNEIKDAKNHHIKVVLTSMFEYVLEKNLKSEDAKKYFNVVKMSLKEGSVKLPSAYCDQSFIVNKDDCNAQLRKIYFPIHNDLIDIIRFTFSNLTLSYFSQNPSSSAITRIFKDSVGSNVDNGYQYFEHIVSQHEYDPITMKNPSKYCIEVYENKQETQRMRTFRGTITDKIRFLQKECVERIRQELPAAVYRTRYREYKLILKTLFEDNLESTLVSDDAKNYFNELKAILDEGNVKSPSQYCNQSFIISKDLCEEKLKTFNPTEQNNIIDIIRYTFSNLKRSNFTENPSNSAVSYIFRSSMNYELLYFDHISSMFEYDHVKLKSPSKYCIQAHPTPKNSQSEKQRKQKRRPEENEESSSKKIGTSSTR